MSTLEVARVNCFICGETKELVMNRILLPGIAKKVKDMDGKCVDTAPCQQCQEHMAQGIILISVRDEQPTPNPYRTGGWVVIKEEAFMKVFNAPDVLKKRIAFIPDSIWDQVGLPRGSQL